MRIFPYLVGILELGAGLVYAWNSKWWLALAWISYAVAAYGLARAS